MDRKSFLLSVAGLLLPTLNLKQPLHSLPARGLYCTRTPYGVQCEAGIESSILDVVASDTQHLNQWCWAACIEAIFSYYGHDVPQESIVAEAYGGIVNMPGSPYQILRALNRRWTDSGGNEFRVYGSTMGTNAVTAAQDLASDHPLIIGTLGHAMVLSSLTYITNPDGGSQVVNAEVRDPWPYRARHRSLTAQEWYSISFAARIRVVDA
jgi:hypothetical protein